MSLFQRREQPAALLSPEIAIVTNEVAQDVDPFAFVAEHCRELDTSSRTWKQIADRANEMRAPKSLSSIEDGLVEIYANSRFEADDVTRQVDAKKIGDDLAVYSLLAARYLSRNDQLGLQDLRSLYATGDSNIAFLLGRKKTNIFGFTNRVMNMQSDMRKADRLGYDIIEDFTSTYEEQPEEILTLAELYSDGIGTTDASFHELQAVIALDWHAADSKMSLLKGFCTELREDPSAFVGSFGEQVEIVNQGQQMTRARHMAEFAVAAFSNGGVAPTVSDVLRRSYKHWAEFPEIHDPFERFVKLRVAEIERALSEIAGPFRKKNIRTFRTENELREYQRTLKIIIGRAEMEPPRQKHKASAAPRREAALPTNEDIDLVAQEEIDQQSRRLFVVKNVMDGTNTAAVADEQPLHEVLTTFGMKNSNGLEEDVTKMLKHLRLKPISRATVKLKCAGSGIVLDGARVGLWRFAPEDSQGLSVRGENRYYRIVYGFKDDKLYVVDILDHGSFDKKYGG